MFFTRMDYNGDGSVQFHELVKFLEGISQPITLEQEQLPTRVAAKELILNYHIPDIYSK